MTKTSRMRIGASALFLATALVVVLYRLAQPEGPDDHALLEDRGAHLALASASTEPGRH